MSLGEPTVPGPTGPPTPGPGGSAATWAADEAEVGAEAKAVEEAVEAAAGGAPEQAAVVPTMAPAHLPAMAMANARQDGLRPAGKTPRHPPKAVVMVAPPSPDSSTAKKVRTSTRYPNPIASPSPSFSLTFAKTTLDPASPCRRS